LSGLLETAFGYRSNPLVWLWLKSLTTRRGVFFWLILALFCYVAVMLSITPAGSRYSSTLSEGLSWCRAWGPFLFLGFVRAIGLSAADHNPRRRESLDVTALSLGQRYWGRMIPLLWEVAPFMALFALGQFLSLTENRLWYGINDSSFRAGVYGDFFDNQILNCGWLGAMLLAGVWNLFRVSKGAALWGAGSTLIIYWLAIWMGRIPRQVTFGWNDYYTVAGIQWQGFNAIAHWTVLVLALIPGPLILLALTWIKRRESRRAVLISLLRGFCWYVLLGALYVGVWWLCPYWFMPSA